MKKEMNNKGFSLVELIIVIAIMAVLMGILAPQYLKYVKRSKVSTDITNAEEIATAVGVAIADNNESSIQTTAGTGYVGNGTQMLIDEGSGSGAKKVVLPTCKVDSEYEWKITWDGTNGVTKITLNDKEIWPNSHDYEEAEK